MNLVPRNEFGVCDLNFSMARLIGVLVIGAYLIFDKKKRSLGVGVIAGLLLFLLLLSA